MSLSNWILQRTGMADVIPTVKTDEEIDAGVRAMQADDLTYQQALDEITLDQTILNKDRARERVAEMYGITDEVVEEKQKLPPVSKDYPWVSAETTLPYVLPGDETMTSTLPILTTPLFE